MKAAQRRAYIAQRLRQADCPLSATLLAEEMSVSRQIVVGDVALLRAGGEDILATPRGYILRQPAPGLRVQLPCRHTLAEMEEELCLMVDQGCVVEDVVVEHSVYGQLSGQLMVSNRYEVAQFLRRLSQSGARPLSELTQGIHLHTVRCPDQAALGRVRDALTQAGYLLTDPEGGDCPGGEETGG